MNYYELKIVPMGLSLNEWIDLCQVYFYVVKKIAIRPIFITTKLRNDNMNVVYVCTL